MAAFARLLGVALVFGCAPRQETPADGCASDRAAIHDAGELRRACELGDVDACSESGAACGQHDLRARAACDPRFAPPWAPTASDTARAAELYEKWCSLAGTPGEWGNHPEACVKLARSYRARGTSSDRERARTYAARACDRGLSEGCNELGQIEVDAGQTGLAITHLRAACRMGSTSACSRLAGGERCVQPVEPDCDRLRTDEAP